MSPLESIILNGALAIFYLYIAQMVWQVLYVLYLILKVTLSKDVHEEA